MRLTRVGAAVVNQTALDWDGNLRRVRSAMRAARDAGVDFLCLPELCLTGYGCEDQFASPALQRIALEVLHEALDESRGMVVALGLPLRFRNGVFDAVAVAVDGRLGGFVAKQHLAGDGLHYEPRWFKAWPAGVRAEVDVGGVSCPVGDLTFDCGGITVGFEICEDAWRADRPGISLARRGADLILNPSASHFAFGKLEIRKRFVLEGSRMFGATYVYSNLLGNDAGRMIYDGGALIASGGRIVAQGERFGCSDFVVTSAVVDVEATRMTQALVTGFATSFVADDTRVALPFTPGTHAAPAEPQLRLGWEAGAHLKEEEFTRALTLGLFDYLRKSRSRGFVVSASGGADSSAVACLCAMAVERAAGELGMDGLRAALPQAAALVEARTARDAVGRLLTCVYQATRYSGAVTYEAARGVAEAVGAEFLRFDVEGVATAYRELVEAAVGRRLEWRSDDVPLQNIQARARAPGIWLLANLRGALLLATSNRSEAAVGYATMDGDTAGGLSPIAGIDKAFLRRWLEWLERDGPTGMRPIPALRAVNAQAPTAELRPPEAGQTDEKDLMPYPVLDAIERRAIRDKQCPVDVFLGLRAVFPEVEPRQLGRWVERFFVLWCQNQWKRERYAPSFHVDDENLDPKTWCRFPILSGGFARELRELQAVIAEL